MSTSSLADKPRIRTVGRTTSREANGREPVNDTDPAAKELLTLPKRLDLRDDPLLPLLPPLRTSCMVPRSASLGVRLKVATTGLWSDVETRGSAARDVCDTAPRSPAADFQSTRSQ